MLHYVPQLLQVLFWGCIGGFAYRTRGGLLDAAVGRALGEAPDWQIPDTLIRAVWGIAVEFCILSYTDSLLHGAIIGCLAFVGTLPGYFGGEFDLSLPANWNWKNYLRLTARGMFTCLPAACYATGADLGITAQALWCGVAAGAVFVPAYLSGKWLYHIAREQGQSQWGEWQLGFSTLAAIAGRFIIENL